MAGVGREMPLILMCFTEWYITMIYFVEPCVVDLNTLLFIAYPQKYLFLDHLAQGAAPHTYSILW